MQRYILYFIYPVNLGTGTVRCGGETFIKGIHKTDEKSK